ncbi:MAG: hypothetical protein HYU27_06255 [Acidobacteria bacterium]|nr:hypothetical protein [Acidobacteriota bacterium]
MNDQEARATLPKRGEKPTKKNFRLYQSKIDRARQALRAESETEVIDRALDLVIFRDELVKGARGMKGAGLTDIFDREKE